MRNSLYWDDFSRRIDETLASIKTGVPLPVRRVAIFATDACNFKCQYCNVRQSPRTMKQETFEKIVAEHGETAIIHITGGEPSVVNWLYPYLRANGDRCRFHLNTNAYLTPPAESVKRLKISLDSIDAEFWNGLVGRHDAWQRVVANIKASCPLTTVSITCTMTKGNYRDMPGFARFCREEFPGLYAVFFSVYKGQDERFALGQDDVFEFFSNVLPRLEKELDEESLALLRETIDEKMRLMSGVRFPENGDVGQPCYISMSERVYDPDGNEFGCSHLYRDGIRCPGFAKHEKCKYGCNRRLVAFNEAVADRLA